MRVSHSVMGMLPDIVPCGFLGCDKAHASAVFVHETFQIKYSLRRIFLAKLNFGKDSIWEEKKKKLITLWDLPFSSQHERNPS